MQFTSLLYQLCMLVNTVFIWILDFRLIQNPKCTVEPGLEPGSLAALEPESSVCQFRQFRVIYFLWTIFNYHLFVCVCQYMQASTFVSFVTNKM